jgi:hypothetical protein
LQTAQALAKSDILVVIVSAFAKTWQFEKLHIHLFIFELFPLLDVY